MTPNFILTLSLIVGFYMAWNIGANDVANAFGTSVGSGSLTYRQAIWIAAVFEFAGAVLAGSHVADTIRGNVVAPAVLGLRPELFAAGMLASLLAASIWLHVSTFRGQPVSTTHAIVGAVIGFGFAAVGLDGVRWSRLGGIAASWFVSPLVGGVLAYAIYRGIRRFILRRKHPAAAARAVAPFGFGVVVLVIGLSVLPDLLPRLGRKTAAGGVPLCVAAAIVAVLAGRVWARRAACVQALETGSQHRAVECWFGYLQVVTACYMAFAHGANDVANAIGPIAGILLAAQGASSGQTAIPLWLMMLGGLGIVAGLAMYGRKVIEAVGHQITEVTPTRGFAAAMGTASTVLACSLLGLPISTTFVLVGAVMGVGLAQGFSAINLKTVQTIFMSWLVTIPATAALSATLYFLAVHILYS